MRGHGEYVRLDRDRFLGILRDPARLLDFDLRSWDEFLPMANQLEILPHLVARLDSAGQGGQWL